MNSERGPPAPLFQRTILGEERKHGDDGNASNRLRARARKHHGGTGHPRRTGASKGAGREERLRRREVHGPLDGRAACRPRLPERLAAGELALTEQERKDLAYSYVFEKNPALGG
jgi:hypothetical protein